MTEKFTRYDSADYLKTEDDIVAYIEAVTEDGDPALITHALGVVARARNMSQLARDAGLSREGVYKALAEDGNPSFATVAKLAHALGFKLSLGSRGSRGSGLATKQISGSQEDQPTKPMGH